jgi:ribosomal protein S14
MAQIFISESSRRNQQVSSETMEENWNNAFGTKKEMTCSICGKPPYNGRLYTGGVCRDCRETASTKSIGPHIVIK